MKPSSLIVGGAGLIMALAACQTGKENSEHSSRNRFGYHGETDGQTQFASPTPSPSPFTTESTTPNTATSPTPTPAVAVQTHDIMYGVPVPGKPGFVTSPHSPYAGYVDVRGFPPGTEVKCPYSGKIFLVP